MQTLADIAAAARAVWLAARDAGNPNHDTIRRLASLVAEIAEDGDDEERDDALALLAEAESLA